MSTSRALELARLEALRARIRVLETERNEAIGILRALIRNFEAVDAVGDEIRDRALTFLESVAGE